MTSYATCLSLTGPFHQQNFDYFYVEQHNGEEAVGSPHQLQSIPFGHREMLWFLGQVLRSSGTTQMSKNSGFLHPRFHSRNTEWNCAQDTAEETVRGTDSTPVGWRALHS